MDINNSKHILQKMQDILFGESGINADLNDWNSTVTTYKQTPQHFIPELRSKLSRVQNRVKLFKHLTASERILLDTLGIPPSIYMGNPPSLDVVTVSTIVDVLSSIYSDLNIAKSILSNSIQLLQQLSTLEPSANGGEGVIEIVFDGGVKIDNVTEGKEQFNDWFIILEGYAQLLDISRDDFEIMEITKSSPTRMKIKTKEAIITTILATIVPLIQLETAYIGQKTTLATLKANPMVEKDLHNQYMLAAQEVLDKKIEKHIEEIVDKKMTEHNSTTEKKASIHKAVLKQYQFITNGGDVKFYFGDNSAKEEEIAKLEHDKETIKALRDSLNDLKLLNNKKTEDDTNR